MRKWMVLPAALAAMSAPAAAAAAAGAAAEASVVISSSSARFEIGGWRVHCATAQRLFDRCDAQGPVSRAQVILDFSIYGVKLEVSGCGLRPRPPAEEIFWPREGFQIAHVLDRLGEELRLGTGACRTARLAGPERQRLDDLILLLFAATN